MKNCSLFEERLSFISGIYHIDYVLHIIYHSIHSRLRLAIRALYKYISVDDNNLMSKTADCFRMTFLQIYHRNGTNQTLNANKLWMFGYVAPSSIKTNSTTYVCFASQLLCPIHYLIR